MTDATRTIENNTFSGILELVERKKHSHHLYAAHRLAITYRTDKLEFLPHASKCAELRSMSYPYRIILCRIIASVCTRLEKSNFHDSKKKGQLKSCGWVSVLVFVDEWTVGFVVIGKIRWLY